MLESRCLDFMVLNMMLFAIPMISFVKLAAPQGQKNVTVRCGYKSSPWILHGDVKCACNADDWETVENSNISVVYCRKTCEPVHTDCPSNTTCVSLSSNHSACVCANGYQLSAIGACYDIDECQTSFPDSPCPANLDCVNSLGSFFCECKAGYSDCTDGRTVDPGTSPLKPEADHVLVWGLVGGFVFLLLLFIFGYLGLSLRSSNEKFQRQPEGTEETKMDGLEQGHVKSRETVLISKTTDTTVSK